MARDRTISLTERDRVGFQRPASARASSPSATAKARALGSSIPTTRRGGGASRYLPPLKGRRAYLTPAASASGSDGQPDVGGGGRPPRPAAAGPPAGAGCIAQPNGFMDGTPRIVHLAFF
jgi:hypothetical protein